MYRQDPILTEIQQALDNQAWTTASHLMEDALRAGIRYSQHRVPLTFLLTDLPQRKSAAAHRAAQEHLRAGQQAQKEGEWERSRRHLRQALALPELDRPIRERLEVALEQVQTAEAVAISGGAVDHLGAMLAELLNAIHTRKPKLFDALKLAAIPLWLDESVWTALRGEADGKAAPFLDHLNQYSFAHLRSGRITLTKQARQILLQEWDAADPLFVAYNRRLMDYFSQRLTVDPPRDSALYELLLQSSLYHTFIVDPQAGSQLLTRLFRKAEDEQRFEAARHYIQVCKELVGLIPEQYYAYVEHAEAYLYLLRGRRYTAADRFQQLAARPDLLPDVRARVEWGMGLLAVEEEDWARGIVHYETALDLYRAEGNEAERAYTMVDLSRAYLDMATQLWQGNQTTLPAHKKLFTSLLQGLGALFRLPLLIYLATQLGWAILLPNLFHVGQGMDWIVARLLSLAAHWQEQAERLLRRSDDGVGLGRAQENLAQLYLTLTLDAHAERLCRGLLDEPGAQLSTYRKARIQLMLSSVILRQGKTEEAQKILDQAMVVFQSLGHTQRIAQSQTALGHLAVAQGDPNQALAAYRAALDSWTDVGNPTAATDMLHNMEALSQDSAVTEQRKGLLAEIEPDLRSRVYETRYVHPWMVRFYRFSLVALILVSFITLFLSVRTESGTSVGAEAVLVQPIQRGVVDEFGPRVELTITQQLRPSLNTHFVGSVFGMAALGYLILYTLLGFFLIGATSLDTIQRHRPRRLTVELGGVTSSGGDEFHLYLSWELVRTLYWSSRRLWRRPVGFLSEFAFVADQGQIVVPGATDHYDSLQDRLRQRLRGTIPFVDADQFFVRSPLGILLTLSLGAFFLFVTLASLAPNLLTTPLGNFPYVLADFYSLTYIGIGLPLIYWFALHPVRTRIYLEPTSPLLWVPVLVSTLLAFIYLTGRNAALGRPNITLQILTLMLLGLTLFQIWQARYRYTTILDDHTLGAPVYPLPVRLVVTLLTLLLMGSVFVSLNQEVASFQHLAQGNRTLQRAEEARGRALIATSADEQAQYAAEAESLYRQALAAYAASVRIQPQPYIFNSQGAAYTQIGDFEGAIQAYQRAAQLDPIELAYQENIALTYKAWASATAEIGQRLDYLQTALDQFDRLIQELAIASSPNPQLAQQAHEFRAGVYYDLAFIHYDNNEREAAYELFRQAVEDYDWLLARSDRPAAYVGKGWATFYLRYETPAEDLAQREALLETAGMLFQAALNVDPDYSPAYNGLGWVYFYLGRAMDVRCTTDNPDPDLLTIYVAQNRQAVQAFGEGIRQDPRNPVYYRTRAQLHFILASCPGHEWEEEIRLAMADYDGALANSQRSGWYYTRANLAYALATRLATEDRVAEAETLYREAGDGYLQAIRVEPNFRDYWRGVLRAYRQIGRSEDQALADILHILDWEAGYDTPDLDMERVYWLLGWALYSEFGRYDLSSQVTGWAIAVTPANPELHFNQGLAYLANGDVELARRSYGAGIEQSYLAENAPSYEKQYTVVMIDDLNQIRQDPSAGKLTIMAQLAAGYIAAHQIHGDPPEDLLGLGWKLYTAGLPDPALQLFQRAAQLLPDEPRVYFNQAVALLVLGDAPGAEARIAEGIAAARHLSDPELSRQRLQEAIADLESAPTQLSESRERLLQLLTTALPTE